MATSLPGLVFNYAGEEQRTTLYSISDGAHRPCVIPDVLRGKQGWVTSRGWVLVWDPSTLDTLLWSPNKGEVDIVLPPLSHPPHVTSHCLLSAKPTDLCGFTVLLSDSQDTVLWYCHVGGEQAPVWVRHEYDVGRPISPLPEIMPKRRLHSTAACHGRFYYFRRPTELGVLEFSPGPVFTTVSINFVGPDSFSASPHCLNIDDELYIVYVFYLDHDFYTVKDVGVYRVDFNKKKAVKVNTIGGRAIMAGTNCDFAAWCSANTFGLLPNTVYWMSPNNNRLHVYDLGKKTMKVREPYSGVAKPSRLPFWLVPKNP